MDEESEWRREMKGAQLSGSAINMIAPHEGLIIPIIIIAISYIVWPPIGIRSRAAARGARRKSREKPTERHNNNNNNNTRRSVVVVLLDI